ncbi:hypothetical protein [Clostridium polynesiense]|uniref:hypothetical protein n=1 Tax=Clostridium polynesiense TaxID=1325933 RepID=UPI000B2429AB|nr:hypothetical protein [Clostridium polynesiense]
MKEIYMLLADGYEKLAQGFLTLAQQGKEVKEKLENEGSGDGIYTTELEVTIEMVRAILAKKSQEGKISEVKDLLMKYDAGKLSGVNPKDYASLIKEAELL